MPHVGMRDGAALHYLDVGRGEPCVMLHGFAMFSGMWLPAVVPLMKRHRFIIPDLRGWGASHALPLRRCDAITQHADDVADLLNGLALERVHLVGLSMGACAAMQYLQDYGTARVQAYMNVDQAPRIQNCGDWQYGLLGDRQAQFVAFWRDFIDRITPYLSQPFHRVPRSLRRDLFNGLGEFVSDAFHRSAWRALSMPARHGWAVERVMRTDNWPVYIATLAAFVHGDHDWRGSLRRCDVPVTVVVGGESRLYAPAGQACIAGCAPRARVVEVPQAGHVVPFDAPRRFTRELRSFLDATHAVAQCDPAGESIFA